MRAQKTDAYINVDGNSACYSSFRGKRGFTENWTTGHLCYTEAKNLNAFCPYLETLWEAELKGDELVSAFSHIYSENQGE